MILSAKTILACLSEAQVGWINREKMADSDAQSVLAFKVAASRDFLASFIHKSNPPGPLINVQAKMFLLKGSFSQIYLQNR